MDETLKTPPPAVDADRTVDALTGTTVGRFSISKRLGAGGMGQVYGAEDTTLKRRVAIKRMAPQANSTEADSKRLLKEAQRASALNHPNIGAMYDVVEHAGELWLVMEYVEGETLRQRLSTPISSEEFFSIAGQCCEGLQSAHEKGIIHGDIKPENIMLTPGDRVKILDFGVARRAWSSNPNEATKSMETMTASGGTPAYMAPEVLLQQPDDGRSDLFSLGLVFYEMLGGEQPFRSESLATTVAKIVHVNPAPLKNVPAPLAAIVTRALAKNPDLRYPSAGALLDDLRRVEQGGKPRRAPGAGAKPNRKQIFAASALILLIPVAIFVVLPLSHRSRAAKSSAASADTLGLPETKILAVLPFTVPAFDSSVTTSIQTDSKPSDWKPDLKLIALGEGLAKSVAAKLARLSEDRAFEVVAPATLQDKKIYDLPAASGMFGANLGLALNLKSEGELVKITYTILGTRASKPLSTASLTVPKTDAFAAEQFISDGAVQDLHLQLRPEEEAALKYHGTDQAAAYDYYLQAQGYLLDYGKPENIDNAALMAREALKLDPNFGMAKAILGETFWFKYSDTKQKQWIEPAQTNCKQAINLGNAGAAGHVCLGLTNEGTGLYPEAINEFQTALGLEPTNEEAALHLALADEHQGKITDAEKTYQQAIQAHPNSRFSYNNFGNFYNRRNEYEKALQMYEKVIRISPEWYGTYVNVGSIYAEMGQYEKALAPLNKSIAIRPSYPGYVNLGTAYDGLGRFADAAQAYEEAAKIDPQQYVVWGNLGGSLYHAGKKNQSIIPYRKAVNLAAAELKVNPHDPDVLSNLATYSSMVDDREKALFYLDRALKYGRNDKDVLLDAASVYNHLGENGLALEYLSKMLQAGYTTEKIRSLHEFDNLSNLTGYQQLVKSPRH